MVIIERKFLFLKDKLVFFPSSTELDKLIKSIGKFELLRIKETDTVLPKNISTLFDEREFRTNFIDLTKDLNEIWKEMDKSSCRYEIRKAEKWKEKIRITVNQNPEIFLKLYNDFVKRKKHIFPISKKRLNDYLRFSDFFLCYFDKKPMIGHLLLRDEKIKILRLIFSATRRLESRDYAKLSGSLNRYLHWHEFQYYKNQGFYAYDVGGVGSGKRKAAKFKLSLGGYRVRKNNYILGRLFIKNFFQLYSLVQKLRNRFY